MNVGSRLMAAAAVLCTTADSALALNGFNVRVMAMNVGSEIRPSSGVFNNLTAANPGAFLDTSKTNALVRSDFEIWDPAGRRAEVDDTTYFAFDSAKPSNFSGESLPLNPFSSDPITNPAPAVTLATSDAGGVGLGQGINGLRADGTAIEGGSAGWGFGPDFLTGNTFARVQAGLNSLNGVEYRSLFIARFVLPAGATLVGDDLRFLLGAGTSTNWVDLTIPLDGGVDDVLGDYRFEYERSPAGAFAPAGYERLDMYIVPGPGAAAVLGLGGLAALRRRR